MVRITFLLICYLIPIVGLSQGSYKTQRKQMVKIQLKARDIVDSATLKAMETVQRHKFVPRDMQKYSYSDGALPIGQGQTISQPYIVAFMTQALGLKPNHRVLEIGTGSGYQAAVLAEIVDTVFTMEIVRDLGKEAKIRLAELGYTNIEVKIGDGYHGWKEKGPFDAIMVTAGAEIIPQPLLNQLKDGGRMIIPIGAHNSVRQLVRIDKRGDKIKTKNLMAVRFVPFTRKE